MSRGRLDGLPSRTLPGGLRLFEARGPRARTLGLALMSGLPGGHALAIPRCWSVHTFGMRFALDVLFLDRRGRVIRIDRSVPPRRVVACLRADSVIEVREGDAGRVLSALSQESPPGAPGGTRAPTGPAPP